MIEGTQTLTPADLTAAQQALGRGRVLALWQGTLALLVLGAIIGIGAVALIGKVIGTAFEPLGTASGWGVAIGSALLVLAGAVRLSRTAAAPFTPRRQTIGLDAAGVHLSTDLAESLMRWPMLKRRVDTADLVILESTDNTLVLLRPDDFAPGAFAQVRALVESAVTAH